MKKIFDMGRDCTFSNAPAEPFKPITLESCEEAIRDLKFKLADVKGPARIADARWMPKGFWAVTGHNSVYLMTPNGPISWKTDYRGRITECDPPDLMERMKFLFKYRDLQFLDEYGI